MELFQRMNGETSKAYSAFVLYRDMGAARTVQRAWELYRGEETQAPGYFRQWASDHAWKERAEAWDDHQQALTDAVMGEALVEERRQQIAEGAYRDYERLLEEWTKALARTKFHYTEDGGIIKDPQTGAELKLIRVRLNVLEFWRLTRWRLTIEQIGRLALGMPMSVRESRLADKDGDALPFSALLDDSDAETDED